MARIKIFFSSLCLLALVGLFVWVTTNSIIDYKNYSLLIVPPLFLLCYLWWKIYLFCFLLFIIPITTTGIGSPLPELLLMFFFIIWLTDALINQKNLLTNKPTSLMALFFLWCVVSVLSHASFLDKSPNFLKIARNLHEIIFFPMNYYPFLPIRSLFTLLESILLLLFVANDIPKKDTQKVIYALILSSLFVSFFTMREYIFFGASQLNWIRTSGPFANPNILGGYLAIVISMLFPMFGQNKNLERGAILALLSAALLTSGSKGALLSCLLTLGIYLSCVIIKPSQLKTQIIKIAFFFIGIAAIVSLFFILKSLPLSVEYVSDILHGRPEIWKAALHMIRNHPVFGIGLGEFGFQFQKYIDINNSPDIQIHAHNIFLHVFTELGVVGIIIALTIAAHYGITIHKRINLLEKHSIHYVILLPLLATLIHGMADCVMIFIPISLIFGVLVGLLSVEMKETK